MSQNNSPTSTDSAPDVQVRFQFGQESEEQYLSSKCSQCKTVTPNAWKMLHVVPVGLQAVDPLEINQMARRLVICQNCGNMKLVK